MAENPVMKPEPTYSRGMCLTCGFIYD